MTHIKRAILTAVVVMISIATLPAYAQDRDFNLQTFKPSPLRGAFLTVDGGWVDDHLGFGVGGLFDYQLRPIIFEGLNGSVPLVEHHLTLDILASLSIYKIFEFGIAIPVVLYQDGADVNDAAGNTIEAKPRGTAGLSDLRLHLKLDLLNGVFGEDFKNVGFSFLTTLTFPAGNAIQSNTFMGDSNFGVHSKFAVEGRFWRMRLAVNLGYQWTPGKQFYQAEVGSHRFTYGLAADIKIIEDLKALVEMFGQTAFSTDPSSSPFEMYAALKYQVYEGVWLTFGAGAGIRMGSGATDYALGTPIFRALTGVMWQPLVEEQPKVVDTDGDGLVDEDDRCPLEAEDNDNFQDGDGCPDTDNDGDGILDDDDQCRDTAEDIDEFEDEDGCPDEDNDGDKILDDDDQCKNRPEDMDEFEDEDGCPDEDDDGDGIKDVNDRCRLEKEDIDEFEDEDGCPDPDNDKDGIKDEDDQCPNEAEIYNDVDDTDGCPDEGVALVEIRQDYIEIKEEIRFRRGSSRIVGRKSYRTIRSVSAILKSNPDVKIRIEGHTSNTGSRNTNMRLSQKRADEVMRQLVKLGVEEDRFEAIGFGPDVPIGDNNTRVGRAKNRRVEFHMIQPEKDTPLNL